MRIKDYEHGRIVIDGQEETSDVVLTRDEIHSDWTREGELLGLEDLETVVEAGPDILVVGTGRTGDLRPQPGLEEALKGHGITMLAMPTTLAVQRFNDLRDNDRDVAGAFHVT